MIINAVMFTSACGFTIYLAYLWRLPPIIELNIFIFWDVVYNHMAGSSGEIPHSLLCLYLFCIVVLDEPIFITFLWGLWSGLD